MSESKSRGACDGCHSAKVKCNREVPCERCERRGVDCTYNAFRFARTTTESSHSVATVLANSSVARNVNFDEHHRRTWAVFFALFKKFKQGCPAFWFNRQLMKMIVFLENRATNGHSLTLEEFKRWCRNLRIDLPEDSPNRTLAYHHFDFEEGAQQLKNIVSATSTAHKSVEELKGSAIKHHRPWLMISEQGQVEINEKFTESFDCDQTKLEGILKESNGGLLPWGGDLIAKLVSSERDLSLYIQGVAVNFEQLGPPMTYPSMRKVPSIHLFDIERVNRGVSKCIVHALQIERVNLGSFTVQSAFMFEFPEDEESIEVSKTALREQTTVPKAYSESAQSAMMPLQQDSFDTRPCKQSKLVTETSSKPCETKSAVELKPFAEIVTTVPQLSGGSDETEWFTNLLSWASTIDEDS